jgi:hypothetical protein
MFDDTMHCALTCCAGPLRPDVDLPKIQNMCPIGQSSHGDLFILKVE